MLAEQGKLGIPVVFEYRRFHLPGFRRGMAGCASLLELGAVWFTVAIRATSSQSAKGGLAQGITWLLRLVALLAIHPRMFGQQWELGVLVVIKIQRRAPPASRRMTVCAAFRKLLVMRILVAVDTGLAKSGETCRAQGLAL